MAGSRLPIVATVLAGAALALAAIAVVVVVSGRGGEARAPAPKPAPAVAKPATAPGAAVEDHTVPAADLAALGHAAVEPADPGGLRLTETMPPTLALHPGDVVTSINGRLLHDRDSIESAVFDAGVTSATIVYAEVQRAGGQVLLRWRVDGDLRLAVDPGRPAPPLSVSPPPPPPPSADPLLAGIEKLDDTHYRVPRATVDAILKAPRKATGGARVVPSVENGKMNGIRLYAIRPGSLYALLGFANGDTVTAINGDPLLSLDAGLAAYQKVKDADQLRVDLVRRGQPLTLTIAVTP